MSLQAPRLLNRNQVAKPWGRTRLPPPFTNSSHQPIGEIWFEGAGTSLDLLVKYLFTNEKLSIQVHPSDEQAAAHGLASGKEECWLVLEADEGAELGIGTREPLSSEELRAAALDGSLEQLIDWKPVSRGDFYYIPAGTVHAIGAGVALVEVQQNADITYRLYDYGRPRELHLDKGVGVARAMPYPDQLSAQIDFNEERQLVGGPKFDLWLGTDWPSKGLGGELAQLIPLAGSINAEGVTANAGDCLVCSPCTNLEVSRDTKLLIAQARPAT